MTASIPSSQTLLVIGGGIAGISAALEAAECGRDVVLVEREPALGGRTVQMYRYFPKLCHPTCGLEINLRRLKANRRVRVLTMADVLSISGTRGAYLATLRLRPRHVNERCTACGDCAKVVEAEIPDRHNHGLGRVKAAYLPHPMAYPQRYVLDPSIVGGADGQRARDACKAGAVDLEMSERTIDIAAGSVIWATGWKPYDAARIQPYGWGRIANVVTSVEFERMADPAGPTGGQLVRPSDGKPARDIAFIQCAGSRDENHLRHCSRVCCMASLKHTRYVREAYGDDGRSTVYYIDIRAIDRFEDFYRQVQADPQVKFIKSKVARIAEDTSGNPVLHGVDTEGYHRYATAHDLVVLAIGMQPETHGIELPADLLRDGSGFIEGSASGGQFAAGAACSPLDVNRSVQSATAAALRAIQVIHKAASAEAGGNP
jgi:quinone-modifying oxidoreductase, subunit QmoA